MVFHLACPCPAAQVCYGLTMLFGSLCLTLQFLPDLPGDIIWIPGAYHIREVIARGPAAVCTR